MGVDDLPDELTSQAELLFANFKDVYGFHTRFVSTKHLSGICIVSRDISTLSLPRVIISNLPCGLTRAQSLEARLAYSGLEMLKVSWYVLPET